jgi:hypothetical protein
MGATTYRLMADFAATSDDPSFAQLIEMSKVVFLSATRCPAWISTRLLSPRANETPPHGRFFFETALGGS